MVYAVLIVVGYLAGSCPFGYWLVRIAKGVDIRTVGSGNIGGTNVWRTYGKQYGLPVVFLDTLKGFGPALAGTMIHSHLAGVAAGAAAVLGHWRPLFLKFERGGKIVATTGGAFLGVAPIVGGIAAGIWLLTFFTTRYASVASMLAGVTLPLFAWLVGYPWPVIAFGGAAGAGIVLLHRANIGRLLAGNESRATLRRRGATPRAEPSSGPSS